MPTGKPVHQWEKTKNRAKAGEGKREPPRIGARCRRLTSQVRPVCERNDYIAATRCTVPPTVQPLVACFVRTPLGFRLATRRYRSTSMTRFCKSLALTPEMRDACASVRGRIAVSFWRASVDSERMSE